MLKAIIFDMDGVLVDSKNAWYNIFNETLQKFENKTITQEEFNSKVWAKNFSETAKDYFTENKDTIFKYLYNQYEQFHSRFLIMPGAKEIMQFIKENNLKISIATNTRNQQAKKMLEDIGLLDFIDYIIGGDDVPKGKPEPDMLLKTLKDLNLKNNEVIFIGDTIWDKMAAKNAKIKFIGFRQDTPTNIDKLEQLKDFIK